MSVRDVHILGTASQVPTRYRAHNGVFVRFAETGFLFDPGEGTQRQFILADLSVTGIHHILVTHFHGDHCLGLPGIIQRLSLDDVPHPVHVHFPERGEPYYERLRKASIFVERATVVPNPMPRQGGQVFAGNGYGITALPLDHGVPTLGYRLQEPDSRRFVPERLKELGLKGPIVGELQREGKVTVDGRVVTLEEATVPHRGQAFAVVMDTRVCDAAYELAQDVDVLIIESTYLHADASMAIEHGHLTARQAATIAREAGVQQLILTHFSQRYHDYRDFLDEARAIHPNVWVAKDLDHIPFPEHKAPARAHLASTADNRAVRVTKKGAKRKPEPRP